MTPAGLPKSGAIWWFALGYFLCYVPYTSLTKTLSAGLWPEDSEGVVGASLLPLSTSAALVVMVLFLLGTGWWRYASQHTVLGRTVPGPTRWTALSGLCTAVILTTTTLAYTFDGVSIVFVMLLMRGGVLVLAPIVDLVTGRRATITSWIGLFLSLSALVVTFAEDGGTAMTLLCAVDVAFYLAAYFVRLRFMSRLAKSPDAEVTLRYFAEEQLVAVPATLTVLGVLALVGPGELGSALRYGFVVLPTTPMLVPALLIGVLSQGTGIFGTLVFLDRRENTFSVPVNRCASIMAGVVAGFLLAALFGRTPPSAHQLTGAALVVAAILVLSLGPRFIARREQRAAG